MTALAAKRSIKAGMEENGVSISYICKYLGISRRTWFNRMDDPDTFTARELRLLTRVIDKERVLKLIDERY